MFSHPLANEYAGEMLTHSVVSVYNLRVKVAEPGTIITPPSSSPRRQTSAAWSYRSESDEDAGVESDSESGDLDCNTPVAVHFDPHQCLFCSARSTSLHDSLQHMTKMHSFTIPYQEYLTVNVETVAAYMHLVIHGYHECIQCGCRRRTVEGIQHHMAAKGHCRRRRVFAFTVWNISQKSHKGLWTFTLADASPLDKTAHGADSTVEFQVSTQTSFTSL
ncbi:hypothetical protein BBO_00988 [Beauveria brongniartii RCEF 3172]|uniref:ZN622/Rei1/Reh1 zinc finger C2H2-type domain-containing protein n=1 Tax=Beauveria brongniartii RCEF 3172 TaxID=1081107 RepID=A0A167K060_9HYPO|nr:hypothetical protein BBO_00988 [Beauveria brongniartii RCEF 3172]